MAIYCVRYDMKIPNHPLLLASGHQRYIEQKLNRRQIAAISPFRVRVSCRGRNIEIENTFLFPEVSFQGISKWCRELFISKNNMEIIQQYFLFIQNSLCPSTSMVWKT